MTRDKKEHYIKELAQARTSLINVLNALTDEQLQTPIISEGQTWNVLDIVAHLLENERAMSIHVHKIRQGKETVPENFDLDQWNAGLKKRVGDTPPLEQLLEDLAQTRAKTLEVLESIKDDEWELQGRHPLRGKITVEQYYETIAGHDSWHTKDIKKGLGLS